MIYGGKERRNLFTDIMSALTGNRKNYPPEMRQLLAAYGNVKIASLEIGRKPIENEKTIQGVIKFLTRISPKDFDRPPDTLFHAFLVINLLNGKRLILEKNNVLNLEEYTPNFYQNSQAEAIACKNCLKLDTNDLLNNAIAKFGDHRIFYYSSTEFNCQQFIVDILTASKINITPPEMNFIWQDVAHIVPQYLNDISQFATDLGSRIDIIKRGKGLVGGASVYDMTAQELYDLLQ